MGESKINQGRTRACLIPCPFLSKYKGEIQVASKFAKILTQLYPERLTIISNSAIADKKASYHSTGNLLLSMFQYITAEFFVIFELIKNVKRIDVIFFLGWTPFLSHFMAKVLMKKTISIIHTSVSRGIEEAYKNCLFGYGGKIAFNVVEKVEKINHFLSELIFVDSESLIKQLGLEAHGNKVRVNSSIFVNVDAFKINKGVNQRENVIGYIGRLSEEKGISNLISAIPEILRRENNVTFLILGEGTLLDVNKEYLENVVPPDRIRFLGWVPYEEMPKYLNALKLLILPSHIEGVPNVVLEAMACGTPVLATPVGGIPEIIKDGETGFILENNTPEQIVEGTIRVLNYPKLKEVTKNARKLIKEKYTFETRVRAWKKNLLNLG